MTPIKNAIYSNPLFTSVSKTKWSAGTELLREVINNSLQSDVPSINYIHGIRSYSSMWYTVNDLFQYITPSALKQLQDRKCFFLFDNSNEGEGDGPAPNIRTQFLDSLYFSCAKHNVSPEMIIFLSSNLQDELNAVRHARRYNCQPVNAVSVLAFEYDFTLADSNHKRYNSTVDITTNIRYQDSLRECEKKFQNKFFASLSRANRSHRTFATFMLCHHELASCALVSHNVLDATQRDILKEWGKRNNFPSKTIKAWCKSLPLTIDRSDFTVNWAGDRNWTNVFDQTLFHIVNETLVDNENNTSLFYSEKTFKPILRCQPFLIYGQPGCNQKLQGLGYKLYDKWFDLSFDNEPDPDIRYRQLLHSAKQACDRLKALSKEEQIKWRFAHQDILLHNCKVASQSLYSKKKIQNLLATLSKITVNNVP